MTIPIKVDPDSNLRYDPYTGELIAGIEDATSRGFLWRRDGGELVRIYIPYNFLDGQTYLDQQSDERLEQEDRKQFQSLLFARGDVNAAGYSGLMMMRQAISDLVDDLAEKMIVLAAEIGEHWSLGPEDESWEEETEILKVRASAVVPQFYRARIRLYALTEVLNHFHAYGTPLPADTVGGRPDALEGASPQIRSQLVAIAKLVANEALAGDLRNNAELYRRAAETVEVDGDTIRRNMSNYFRQANQQPPKSPALWHRFFANRKAESTGTASLSGQSGKPETTGK